MSQAEYVSDELRVELRSGPSTEYRIIDFLKAGTAFEVIERGDGFTNVRTEAGTEGWMPSQYVVQTPSAKQKLQQAEARIATLTANLEEATAGSGNVFAELEQAQAELLTLNTALTETKAELDRVMRVSAGSLEAEKKVQDLLELNEQLRTELRNLAGERERLADNLEERWMLIGAGLVLGGLILGALIKSRPRRSAWS